MPKSKNRKPKTTATKKPSAKKPKPAAKKRLSLKEQLAVATKEREAAERKLALTQKKALESIKSPPPKPKVKAMTAREYDEKFANASDIYRTAGGQIAVKKIKTNKQGKVTQVSTKYYDGSQENLKQARSVHGSIRRGYK